MTAFAVPFVLSPSAIQKIVLHSLLYNIEHIINLDILGNKMTGETES